MALGMRNATWAEYQVAGAGFVFGIGNREDMSSLYYEEQLIFSFVNVWWGVDGIYLLDYPQSPVGRIGRSSYHKLHARIGQPLATVGVDLVSELGLW